MIIPRRSEPFLPSLAFAKSRSEIYILPRIGKNFYRQYLLLLF